MYKSFRKTIPFFMGNADVFTLARILLFGYIFGTFLAAETPVTFYSLMRSAASSSVSIVGSLISAFIPFLFAFAAVYFSKPALLFLVCFCKAVLFAHCSFCCYLAFGSGGWLVRLLLQFSDILLMCVLCRFAICYLGQPKPLRSRDVLFCTGASLLVSIVDVCFISPYLAMLIDT